MPECCLQSFDYSRLNNDQKHLYELSQAFSTGNITGNLADRKPGEITDPRWTALASRMLRLYMSNEVNSFKLTGLVHFIQNVYVQCLFWVKCYPDWTDGSRHIYRILSFSRSLPKNVFIVVKAEWNFPVDCFFTLCTWAHARCLFINEPAYFIVLCMYKKCAFVLKSSNQLTVHFYLIFLFQCKVNLNEKNI